MITTLSRGHSPSSTTGMLVGHQQLALEFPEHADEARLVAIIEFAAGEF